MSCFGGGWAGFVFSLGGYHAICFPGVFVFILFNVPSCRLVVVTLLSSFSLYRSVRFASSGASLSPHSLTSRTHVQTQNNRQTDSARPGSPTNARAPLLSPPPRVVSLSRPTSFSSSLSFSSHPLFLTFSPNRRNATPFSAVLHAPGFTTRRTTLFPGDLQAIRPLLRRRDAVTQRPLWCYKSTVTARCKAPRRDHLFGWTRPSRRSVTTKTAGRRPLWSQAAAEEEKYKRNIIKRKGEKNSRGIYKGS